MKLVSKVYPSKRRKLKGRNKHRPKGRKMEASEKLCQAYVKDRDCSFGDRCKFSHDKAKFLETKPEDIGKKKTFLFVLFVRSIKEINT